MQVPPDTAWRYETPIQPALLGPTSGPARDTWMILLKQIDKPHSGRNTQVGMNRLDFGPEVIRAATILLSDAMSEGPSGIGIEQVVATMDEPLDGVRFLRTWQRVADRHSVLRSQTNSRLTRTTYGDRQLLLQIEHSRRRIAHDAVSHMMDYLKKLCTGTSDRDEGRHD
jgi:hypothetical protein